LKDHPAYRRYHIESDTALEVAPYPSRFRVRVGRVGLAKLLLREILHSRLNRQVIVSRPCLYGVFSGPIGGFAPRPKLCVGCLRCMTEYPEFVRVSHNPDRQLLGDTYFTPQFVDAVTYEAQTGKVPVKGAGFRGRFGGEGWDGMWTDMSEIVRPTRDGIHGREFISTVVDVAERPPHLLFDENRSPIGATPRGFSLPLPVLFDVPPPSLMHESLLAVIVESARVLETLVILPLSALRKFNLHGSRIVPLVGPENLAALHDDLERPLMFEMASWDEKLYDEIRTRFPESISCLRLSFATGFEEQLLRYVHAGVRVFHLVADFHGRGENGDFASDLIRKAHQTLVRAGCRDSVTLIGGGGIVAAEHVPKAIICGLDLIALDTPVLVALQAEMVGECAERSTSRFNLPNLTMKWGVQRLKNLMASWRDQLLEVLGAMGLREVRRLRGEIGRAMFQKDLEREAFTGITGYEDAQEDN
jgi:hypothetical protein